QKTALSLIKGKRAVFFWGPSLASMRTRTMQRFLQGQVNMLEWLMVDSTDFATPESNCSNIMNIKVYGTLIGNSNVFFIKSGVGSLAASNRDVVHVGASALGIYAVPFGSGELSDSSNVFYDTYIVAISA